MHCLRVICVVAVSAVPVAMANPVLLLPNSVGTQHQVTVSGRVLKSSPSSGSSTLSKNLRRLLSSNSAGTQVEVLFAEQKQTLTSGHDGEFTATFTAGEGQLFSPGLQSVTARIENTDSVTATVDVIADQTDFFVISDFDDTLAISEVVHKRQLLKNALLKDEATQAPVKGMAPFISCLASSGSRRRSLALVSGSPSQYVLRVRRFLFTNGFPSFGEYLRNLGPDTLRDYKQPIIRNLMKSMPNSVVLVGDSGEHDPEIYAQMRTEFPDRVKAIFIRNAGHAEDPQRFEGMTLFNEPSEAAAAAVAQKLITAACANAAFESGVSP